MGWSVAFQEYFVEGYRRAKEGHLMTAHVCGIDIGKTVFHLIGLSKEGHIVIKKRLTRKQLITHTVNMPACLIGMEACSGAHFWHVFSGYRDTT
jgi:hypothetical protein